MCPCWSPNVWATGCHSVWQSKVDLSLALTSQLGNLIPTQFNEGTFRMHDVAVCEEQTLTPDEWGELAVTVACWPGRWMVVIDCRTGVVRGKVVDASRLSQRASFTVGEVIRSVSRPRARGERGISRNKR